MASSIQRFNLEQAVGVDAANAIDARIDEKISLAFDAHKTELRQIVDDQVRISNEARALPPEQRREVAQAVNDSNQHVRTAVTDTNDIAARQRAGEHIDPSEYERVEREREVAREQQAEADRRLASAQRAREQHDQQTSAPAASRPASGTAVTPVAPRDVEGRLQKLEGALFTRPGDVRPYSRLDDIEASQRESDSILLSSYGMARRAISSTDAGAKAARAGLATFAVVFLLYCLFWIVNFYDWDWSNALGIPAIVAGIVAAVVWSKGSSSGSQSEVMTWDQVRADNDQYDARRRDLQHQQEQRRQQEREDAYRDEHSSSRDGVTSFLRRP